MEYNNLVSIHTLSALEDNLAKILTECLDIVCLFITFEYIKIERDNAPW